MKSDMIQKYKIFADGKELSGLINIDEYEIADETVDVPGYDKTVPVRNGVRKIPPVNAVFKHERGSSTISFLKQWYSKGETHDITLVRTDGSGEEIERELWPNTEISKFNSGGYDASAPGYAQKLVRFLPEDIISI